MFTEGTVAQLLHVGRREDEPEAVEKLIDAIEAEGHERVGPLHILQLAGPDDVPERRGRAIIRQPIV